MKAIAKKGEIDTGPRRWGRQVSSRGFTLVEMLVVMTIILIALTMVLPAASQMWNERKTAETENTIKGLLMTSRARSLREDGAQSGLFFFVDETGAQRIQSIEHDRKGLDECQQRCLDLVGSSQANCLTSCQVCWTSVFRTTDDRQQRLPVPMRVVPRYVVETGSEAEAVFTAEELANNSFTKKPKESNHAQRHRNFFTMVYSSDGRLVVRRDVLIRDDDIDEDGKGDITGLDVGYDYGSNEANVQSYYEQDDSVADIDATGNEGAVDFLIIDLQSPSADRVAINFPSVDGLLAYDDSAFNNLGTPESKREYLLASAQPYYVSRMTGTVVKGPIGEIVP